MPAADVRRLPVHTLGLDLIGPDRDFELTAELLPQAPSRRYLTGFLVPLDAPRPTGPTRPAQRGSTC